MAGPRRVGRVFCVTGVQQTEPEDFLLCHAKQNASHTDTESNSSGYVSSSSFDSTGEERRIVPNEHKVFQIWERWSEHVQIPKSSTPKDTSTRRLTNSKQNLLTIRKTLGKNCSSSQKECETKKDSFRDIEIPERLQVADRVKDDANVDRPNSVPTTKHHDAGSEIPQGKTFNREKSTTNASTDWRRKPFLTLSNSDSDLRSCGQERQLRGGSRGSYSDSNISEYNCLPRYRVTVDKEKYELSIDQERIDFYGEGLPVDESMTEFISTVDKDNLAGILQFYDHVTSESANRQTKTTTPRIESAYF